MKLTLTDRDRFALFVHLNNIPTANHAEGRRLFRVWTALYLDGVNDAIAEGKTTAAAYDGPAREFELTSSGRDSLIGYLDGAVQQGGVRRLLVPIADALIADRDGPKDDPEG